MTGVYHDRSGQICVPGHDDVVKTRKGVFAILIVGGRLLVSWPKRDPGRAELPGGGIEQSETPHAALLREIREETGLVLAGLNISHSFSRTVYFYAEDDCQYWDYHQQYDLLNGGEYEDLLFSGRRATPEDGYASWERLEDLNDENMHFFHHQTLKELKIAA